MVIHDHITDYLNTYLPPNDKLLSNYFQLFVLPSVFELFTACCFYPDVVAESVAWIWPKLGDSCWLGKARTDKVSFHKLSCVNEASKS